MRLQLILGFLPWILFSAIYGKTRHEIIISLLISSAVFIKTEWRTLQKGYVLSWGTVLFFLFMTLFAVVLKNSWVINHAWLLANLTLAAIAWISLLIGKPFTLQYAREQVPKLIWNKPGFIKVNQIITAVWGSVFIISAMPYLFHFGQSTLDKILYQLCMYGATAFGIWFTLKFPEWYRSKMQKIRNKENPFLNGNYAPIHEESDFNDLGSDQKIPNDIKGTYMRNGPNPAFEPITYTYPFDGDGMIHAITIKDNKAHYRNRYVKTKGLLLEQRHGKALYGGIANPMPLAKNLLGPNDDPDPIKNGAFIHVIKHGDHYLALNESSAAYEINSNLETIGEWCPDTNVPLEVGPHTRLDPVTQDLHFINYNMAPPYLVCHRVNINNELIETRTIEKPYCTMMHDFAMTKNYWVLFDGPALINPDGINTGDEILQWREELGMRIGIVSRHHNDEIIWINTAAFFVFHFANAYEENNLIIVDYVRHQRLDFGIESTEQKQPRNLYRMIIDLNNHSVQEIPLSDHNVEFPTFNRDYNTSKYQYIYAPAKLRNNAFDAVIKYDLVNRNSTIHDFGEECEIGEAVFAARHLSQAEDDGYLMLFAYNKMTKHSDFILLDAKNIADSPVTTLKIPRRVPHGLHGSWITD